MADGVATVEAPPLAAGELPGLDERLGVATGWRFDRPARLGTGGDLRMPERQLG